MVSMFSLISLSSTSSELLHERGWCRGVKSLCKNMIMIMMRWKQSGALSPPPRHHPATRDHQFWHYFIGILRQAPKLWVRRQLVQLNVYPKPQMILKVCRLFLRGKGSRSMYINVKVGELYPPPVAGSWQPNEPRAIRFGLTGTYD